MRKLRDWLGGNSAAVLALFFLVALFALALAATLVAPFGPTAQNLGNTLAEPSWQHWMGTDDLGRDVLSRLIHGAPASLFASFLAVGVAAAIGVPVGLLAGFMGGWVDDAISRVIDTLLSFPGIVLAIGVTGALGIGLTNAMLAVGIVFAPGLARLMRAQTLVVKQELYVDASRCFGASLGRILLRHVMPNAVQPVIVQVTLLLAVALLADVRPRHRHPADGAGLQHPRRGAAPGAGPDAPAALIRPDPWPKLTKPFNVGFKGFD